MIEFPREVIIEENAIDKLNGVMDKMNYSGKGLILTGKTTYEIAGKKVSEISKLPVDVEVIENIDKNEIDDMIIQSDRYEFFIAVGGGKIIDVTKYVSYKLNKDFISIPTALSHDGIASPRATLSFNGTKFSYNAKTPVVILADLNILSKSPYRLFASGAADIISNIVAVEDWRIASKNGERFSGYAAALSLIAANSVIENAEEIKKRSIEGTRILTEALINSGIAMCIAGSSRPASGSEHLFSHAIDKFFPNRGGLHGEQCGIGTIIMAYIHRMDWKKIREVLSYIGAPVKAKEIGLNEKEVIKAVIEAKNIRKNRYTILNEVRLDEGEIRKILYETGVI